MKKTSLTFLWHMHQPDYRLPGEVRNLLPWVRVHATKAYFDMPWLMAQYPGARACINFSGSLLRQIRSYVDDGMRDVWWELTVKPPEALDPIERRFVLEHFFSINWDQQIKPIPGYWRLLQKRGSDPSKIAVERFSDREIMDLQVFFNLAWTGFAARVEYPILRELLDKGGHFTESDKRAVLDIQIEILGRILPMYRALAEAGQIELITTPMNHPILPLLIDSDIARRSAPDRPAPRRFSWPQDAAWHVTAARDQFEAVFGAPPVGMWPAEGSVSPEVIPLFARAGVRWIASDEDVLMASHPRPSHREDALYRPYRLDSPDGPVSMIFRDHLLSDLIGFTYASADPDAAAADLLGRVREGGLRATATGRPLVSLILDGENPWESYPGDGEPFLRALYEKLEAAEDLETVRVCDFLDELPQRSEQVLHHLHSGSWIRANYQIWIGAKETNSAWNLLGNARRHLERTARERGLTTDDPKLREARTAIFAAEGSDWFWWYGDDFSSAQDRAFDSLFRSSLRAVYTALGDTPPAVLHRAIQAVQPHVEIVRPQALIAPTIDGVVANFFEWAGAGRYEPRGGAGSMFRARRYIKVIFFGFDLARLYLRVDPDVDFLADDPSEMTLRILFLRGEAEVPEWSVEVDLGAPDFYRLRNLSEPGATAERSGEGEVAFVRLVELGISFERLGMAPRQRCRFSVSLVRRSIEIDRHPPNGEIEILVPSEDFAKDHWVV